MTTMADVPLAEKIEWLIQWDANLKVRINYCPHDMSYEILFKHIGTDQWHEYMLTDYQLRHNTLHGALTSLRTMIMMTKP